MARTLLKPTGVLLPILAGFGILSCQLHSPDSAGALHLTSTRPAVLVAARAGIASGDSTWCAVGEQLRQLADAAMATPVRSVMDKHETPPSGDRHDFLSPAPLWWPDPEQPDSLPYVWNREGHINPEYYARGDQRVFEAMSMAVQRLALASWILGGEAYATKAASLLRSWFLDAGTAMHPNLNYAWYERGRNTGTAFGIMSLSSLPFLLDAMTLLEDSRAWTSEDRSGMHQWVDAYLQWLTTSTLGRDASKIWNRFGTAYDAQAAACALFLSRGDFAHDILERSKQERIDRLVRGDGRQPYALEREITFSNSVASIGLFFQLATMAESQGIDLWHYRAPGGGSILRAVEFVAPYADSTRQWPYILEVRRELLRPVLAQAAVAYDDGMFRRLLEQLPADDASSPPVFALYPTYYDLEQDTIATRLMVLDEQILSKAREAMERDPRIHAGAMALLRDVAGRALDVAPVSVMQKTMMPPSGSKHDFLSVGGYYWPDTTRPGGLPWIYRDGKVNPTYRTTGDGEQLRTLTRTVPVLALAFAMTGEEPYAEHAARMLRTWFLDSSTRMNPHLRYAHAQPGVSEGSYYGIIHLGAFPMVMDAVGMLKGSPSWTRADERGMAIWCTEFLEWMLHDANAPEAGRVWNNHGTNYDLVAARLALMAGRRGLARQILEGVKHERIDRQIRGDGRLPYELERNRAWGYTAATVDKFVQLATMGSRLGIDLWRYRTPDGGGLRAAIDYLAVYADSSAVWPFADLDFQRYGRLPLARLRSILQRAALAYDEPHYGELARDLPLDAALLQEGELPFAFYPYAPSENMLALALR